MRRCPAPTSSTSKPGPATPLYVVGEGAESGWVIGLVSQQQLASRAVPLSFSRQEADELGGWELTIEGEIRLVDA